MIIGDNMKKNVCEIGKIEYIVLHGDGWFVANNTDYWLKKFHEGIENLGGFVQSNITQGVKSKGEVVFGVLASWESGEEGVYTYYIPVKKLTDYLKLCKRIRDFKE